MPVCESRNAVDSIGNHIRTMTNMGSSNHANSLNNSRDDNSTSEYSYRRQRIHVHAIYYLKMSLDVAGMRVSVIVLVRTPTIIVTKCRNGKKPKYTASHFLEMNMCCVIHAHFTIVKNAWQCAFFSDQPGMYMFSTLVYKYIVLIWPTRKYRLTQTPQHFKIMYFRKV